jgi:NO-binding membrane sensor protein with MHYT domain/nitrogen-specific signal transduction histidine kinase
LQGSYDLWTIFGSFLIACFAGYAAFESIDHTQFSAKPRLWATLGGITLGLGIWSMHFVGMMAWHPDYPLYYSVGRTLLSVLIAIAASIFAMRRVVSNLRSGKSSSNFLEAILVGCGICAMHYVGMSALAFDKGVIWRPGLVVLSLLIAIVASWAAMYLFERSSTGVASLSRRFFASVAIALAICGMHYVGMAAFMPNDGSICLQQPFSFSGTVLARIGVGNALIFTIALLLASYREKSTWISMVSESHLEALTNARKLENMVAVERIIASVAQEISSPLESAMARLRLIDTNQLQPGERTHLTEAQAELQRVASIASHTLKFFRPQHAPSAVSVPELFESVVALFQTPLRAAHIDVQTNWPGNLPTVLCREDEIRLAVANLVSSAIDAMPNGGTLRLGIRPEKAGLAISIADTGSGIPNELRDQILKPFFATKGLRGAALGLSISAETIRRNGGTFAFAIAAPGSGSGTGLDLFLPFASAVAVNSKGSAEPLAAA